MAEKDELLAAVEAAGMNLLLAISRQDENDRQSGIYRTGKSRAVLEAHLRLDAATSAAFQNGCSETEVSEHLMRGSAAAARQNL